MWDKNRTEKTQRMVVESGALTTVLLMARGSLSPQEYDSFLSVHDALIDRRDLVCKKVAAMGVGDKVRVLSGATDCLKGRDQWVDEMGDSIDGLEGKIITDYTKLPGKDSHFEIEINGVCVGVGVGPRWLIKA